MKKISDQKSSLAKAVSSAARKPERLIDLRIESEAKTVASKWEPTCYDPFIEHLEMVCRTANSYFSRNDIPIKLSTKAVKILIKNNLFSDPTGIVGKFVKETERGFEIDNLLHDPQIRTALVVIKESLAKPSYSISVNAPPQAGKTGTLLAMIILSIIRSALLGEKCLPVTLLTPSNGQTSQTISATETFNAMYGHIVISVLDKKRNPKSETTISDWSRDETAITINQYVDRIMNLTNNSSKDIAEHVQNVSYKLKKSVQTTIMLQQRSLDKQRVALVNKISQVAAETGVTMIFIIDEVHFGDTVGGVMASFVGSIVNKVASRDENHIMVSFSATNCGLGDLEDIIQVYHFLGPGYIGPNAINGRKYDPSAPSVFPRYRSIEMEVILNGGSTTESKAMSISEYRSENAYDRYAAREDKRGEDYIQSWDAYRANYTKNIREIIMSYFDINDEPKAMCLRAMNNNSEVREFIKSLKLGKEINVLFFDAAEPTKQKYSLKQFSEKFITSNKTLLVVTGSARMSDSFPNTVLLDGDEDKKQHLIWGFLDLTSKTTTFTALMQGLFGRACGYSQKEPPFVWMSRYNYDHIRMFEMTGYPSLPDKNIIRHNNGKRVKAGRKHINIYVMEQDMDGDAYMRKKIRQLDRLLHKFTLDKNGVSRTTLQGRDSDPAPIWMVLDEEFFTYMEKNAERLFRGWVGDVQFMRPVVNPDTSVLHYECSENGESTFGFRAIDKRGNKTGGGGDGSSRDGRRPESRNVATGKTVVKPQIFLYHDPKTLRWTVKGFMLRLTKEITSYASDVQRLPTSARFSHVFTNARERKIIANHENANKIRKLAAA